jgi:hypothetical protein
VLINIVSTSVSMINCQISSNPLNVSANNIIVVELVGFRCLGVLSQGSSTSSVSPKLLTLLIIRSYPVHPPYHNQLFNLLLQQRMLINSVLLSLIRAVVIHTQLLIICCLVKAV